MIRHFLFYLSETTFITFMVWLGLFLGVNALRRTGIAIRPRWTIILGTLWVAIACIDAVMSERIGPEFTLHVHFGIWMLVGGGVCWIVVWLRQGTTSLQQRIVRRAPPSK
jgi:hypothetical protein